MGKGKSSVDVEVCQGCGAALADPNAEFCDKCWTILALGDEDPDERYDGGD